MQSLEKRIAALEQADQFMEEITFVIRFLSPGGLDNETHRLTDSDGNSWTRQLGETEQELIDRASKETRRIAWGVACVSGTARGEH